MDWNGVAWLEFYFNILENIMLIKKYECCFRSWFIYPKFNTNIWIFETSERWNGTLLSKELRHRTEKRRKTWDYFHGLLHILKVVESCFQYYVVLFGSDFENSALHLNYSNLNAYFDNKNLDFCEPLVMPYHFAEEIKSIRLFFQFAKFPKFHATKILKKCQHLWKSLKNHSYYSTLSFIIKLLAPSAGLLKTLLFNHIPVLHFGPASVTLKPRRNLFVLKLRCPNSKTVAD